MPKLKDKPIYDKRAWMQMTTELLGKKPLAVRKAIYRMGNSIDFEGFIAYLRRELKL